MTAPKVAAHTPTRFVAVVGDAPAFKPLKGHKLVTSWKGCEDSYAMGRCECGAWFYRGWSERMSSVRSSHRGHVATVRAAIAKAQP